jgi:hypothetical protein
VRPSLEPDAIPDLTAWLVARFVKVTEVLPRTLPSTEATTSYTPDGPDRKVLANQPSLLVLAVPTRSLGAVPLGSK